MALTLLEWKEPTGRPLTNFATPTMRNARLAWAFDQTTNETIYLDGVMPQSYGGGALDLHIRCAVPATSGDVDVDVSVEVMDSLDLDGDSFGTVNSTDNTTVPATSGEEFEIAVTLTNDDGIVAGDAFRLRVTRDAASDTAAADLEMYLYELREQ